MSNQLSQAGMLTVASSFIFYRFIPYILSWVYACERFIITEVTVNNKSDHDKHFFTEQFLKQFISKRNYLISRKTNELGYGEYYFWYKYRLIYLHKRRVEQQYENYDELYIKAYFNPNIYTDILAFILNETDKCQTISISLNNRISLSLYRELDRKLLTISQKELYEDIKNFFNQKLIDKKSFLLYGSPGNGKTKSIISIAHLLGKNLQIFSINKDTTPEGILEQMIFKTDYIFLFEDIDRLPITQDKDSEENFRLTKADFLNILDGAIELKNCVVIGTTNHYDKLDDALIRAGRFDEHIRFEAPSTLDLSYMQNEFDMENLEHLLGRPLSDVMLYIKNTKLKNLSEIKIETNISDIHELTKKIDKPRKLNPFFE